MLRFCIVSSSLIHLDLCDGVNVSGLLYQFVREFTIVYGFEMLTFFITFLFIFRASVMEQRVHCLQE